MSNHESIHADQRDAARTMEDGSPFRAFKVVRPKLTKGKLAPKGHEAFLKALESSGAVVTFEKASSGNIITGVIKTSDKYTISIQEKNGTRVLFKHDISDFYVDAPASYKEEA